MSEGKPSLGSNKTLGGIIVAIILGGLYYYNGDTGETTVDENEESAITRNLPKYFGLVDYLPTSTTGKIITHNYYSLSYSEKHLQPEWVAYEISRDNVISSKAKRDELRFRPDPNLDKEIAVVSSDYTRSGYDRGHLLPAQDMSFKEEAMAETFYMTNVSPQDKDFNRGVWKSLELQVRDWAKHFDKLYVVTGPVLTKRAKRIINKTSKKKKKIPVPHSYYKIVLDFYGTDIKMVGFWLKNVESDAPLIAFATSVDDIEEMTGIDFFPELPDDIEDELESKIDLTNWGLDKSAYSMNIDSLQLVIDSANTVE